MLENIISMDIGKNVKLHMIKTDKFKTNLVSVYLQRPLIREEVTKNALLSMILTRGTKNFPTSKELAKTMEDLYGASLGSAVSKKGERNIIQFWLQLVNGRYIDESNLLEKGIKLLNELINQPYLEGEAFKEEYIEQEKANLAEKIEGRKNDKMRYAYDRCVEEMCQGENYALYEYGNLEDLEKISGKALYEHYQSVIESSIVDICVVGNLEEVEIKNLLVESLRFNNESVIEIPREKIHYQRREIKRINEELNINQGKLSLGFRTNIPFEDKLYEPLVVYSNILGGGPNSKLFKNVREKESLCYYIFSRIEKFKSLMLISSGIEFDNYQKTIDLINKEVEEMSKGSFAEEDIESAKSSIITSIRSMTDSPAMLADFYYTQVISKNTASIEDMIDKIKKVDKASIIEAGNHVVLDTVYFLKNKGEVR